MSSILIYFAFLVFPGAVAICLGGISRHRFLMSFFVSLAVFVLSQIPNRVGGGTLHDWIFAYGFLVVLTWCGFLLAGTRPLKVHQPQRPTRTLSIALWQEHKLAISSWLGCVTVWSGLYSLIGPYTEVPSDFWNHLIRMKWEAGPIANGELSSYAQIFTDVTLFNREYIHSLHALSQHLSKNNLVETVFWTQLATTSVFISAVFWFVHAQTLSCWSERKRTIVTTVTTVVTIVWMGTGDWAFVRYYANAPIILSIPLLFLGLLIFIDYLRTPQQSSALTFAALCLILTLQAFIHVQEAITFLVLLALIGIVAQFQSLSRPGKYWPENTRTRITIVFYLFFIFAVAGVLMVLFSFEPRPQHPTFILKPTTSLPLLKDLWILEPSRQVWATITLAGCLSFFLLALNWKIFRLVPYALAGSLLPFVTIFNPLFIHFWERLLPVTILWRFTFFIPVGILVGFSICALIDSKHSRKAALSAFISACFLFLMLPFPSSTASFMTNRAFSFSPLEKNQGIEWLDDVVSFLEFQPRQHIYTDPVTSYVLRALTRHQVPGKKFYPHSTNIDFHKLSATEIATTLKNGLVIINLRDGPTSMTTNALQHWRSDELAVSRFYPEMLPSTLSGLGYKLIWNQDNVLIFTVSTDE